MTKVVISGKFLGVKPHPKLAGKEYCAVQTDEFNKFQIIAKVEDHRFEGMNRGDDVEIECFLNGRTWKPENGEIRYFHELNAMKKIEMKNVENPSDNPADDPDELPF